MNSNNPLSLKGIIISGLALVVAPSMLMATELNLMNEDVTLIDGTTIVSPSTLGGNTDYRMGYIGDALFRRAEAADDTGSGGGVFRNMYSVGPQGGGTTASGFNRNGAGDGKVPGGFVEGSLLTRGDLTTDSSNSYYVFTVDINESNSAPSRFLALDSFEIYAGGTGIDGNGDGDIRDAGEVIEAWGTDPLPQTSAELAAYTTLIYDMDGIEDSTVFLDYSSGTGSGTFDLFVFVPKSLFAATIDNELLYVYTEFGAYGVTASHDFTAEAGSEEIAAYTGTYLGGNINLVPEPSSVMLSLFGATFLLGRRKRS